MYYLSRDVPAKRDRLIHASHVTCVSARTLTSSIVCLWESKMADNAST